MEITADKISKNFTRKMHGTNVFTAVAPTTISLPTGQLTVIRGRSGSGKSTLLNMLGGLLTPTEGRVCYDGEDIYTMTDQRLSAFRNRHIGMIPQVAGAIGSLNVRDNILLPYSLYGDADDNVEDMAEEWMERLDITPLAGAYPGELSGGELRRMAIARAFIRDPEVILADEPTGDLDDENTGVVFDCLRRAADNGKTVLVVTHDAEGEAYADVCYRMDAGVLA